MRIVETYNNREPYFTFRDMRVMQNPRLSVNDRRKQHNLQGGNEMVVPNTHRRALISKAIATTRNTQEVFAL